MAKDSKLFEEAYAAYKSHRFVPKKKYKVPQTNWGKTKAQKKIRRKFLNSKPLFLYVLELEDGCYYIGCTRWPDKRLAAHMKGEGALWTIKHKPIRRIELINTFITNKRTVQLMEDKLTLKYANKYGADYVRGGGYCQTKPRWPRHLIKNRDEMLEELELTLAEDIKLHI